MIEVANPNMLVPYYLMSAWLYEEGGWRTNGKCEPVLSDSDFDHLCKLLDIHWDVITHQHKHLIDRPSLSSSTCYYLTGDNVELPNRLIQAACSWSLDKDRPNFMDVLQKKERTNMNESFILSASDMDSIISSKILCKFYSDACHLSIKRDIDLLPQGSTLLLVRSYLTVSAVLELAKRYNVYVYDLPISDLYQGREKLVAQNIKCLWATTKDTLAYAIWENYYTAIDRPMIVKYTQDYMKWKFDLPETRSVHYAYELVDQKFGQSSILNALIDKDDSSLNKMITDGNDIDTYVNSINEILNKELSFDATLDGSSVICANIPGNNSMVFAENIELGAYELAMLFRYQPGNNKVRSTLFGISPELDVGAICKEHGGGGHTGVGGFTSKGLPFSRMTTVMEAVDYSKYLDKSLLTVPVLKYIYNNIHGYQGNAFYGTIFGKKAVFYNSPYLTDSDFFTNIRIDDCEVKVLFCINGQGLYRISSESSNGELLDDRFGTVCGKYRIDVKPELLECTFNNKNIANDMF